MEQCRVEKLKLHGAVTIGGKLVVFQEVMDDQIELVISDLPPPPLPRDIGKEIDDKLRAVGLH